MSPPAQTCLAVSSPGQNRWLGAQNLALQGAKRRGWVVLGGKRIALVRTRWSLETARYQTPTTKLFTRQVRYWGHLPL